MQQQERGAEYPKKSQRFLDPVRVDLTGPALLANRAGGGDFFARARDRRPKGGNETSGCKSQSMMNVVVIAPRYQRICVADFEASKIS
jgi:hypothetical protein